ncbi:ubiquinone biosynthesis protein COQ9 [Trichophyton equinum CBS 127.97]|uniref:Ubiquinone biosynthesis protein n=1 Tax=Trichophyton equinum (strain ATCC MYA-4606 / CBS 127.97) TaxID=559882 RepID=F2Q5V4_TRIEC|nr:ubiquinone biosynthesis protein COQ9 [Trichophyton equinum CBS 127.97]
MVAVPLIRRQLPQAAALTSSAKRLSLSGIGCSRSYMALPSPCVRPNSTHSIRYCAQKPHPYPRNGPLRRQSPSQVTCGRRTYHHPASDLSSSSAHFSPEQASILSLALSDHVPRLGFTTEAVVLAAQDAGYPEVSLQLFPRGGEIELIIYWLSTRRALLKEKVQNGEIFDAEGQKLSVDQKVKRLVMERLKMNSGIIQHWQDALAVMSLPTNLSSSLHELYELSSDILYLAGDRAVDSSWYSKRLSVSTVYATAEITMTEDKSEGFTSTEEFVERRFGDTDAIVGTVGDVKTYVGFLGGSLVAAGRSLGMKI